LKQLLTAAVALALLLPGCAAEEPKQTEQPAAVQEAAQAPPAAAEPEAVAAKSDSIDDAPLIDPAKQMEPEETREQKVERISKKHGFVKETSNETKAVAEAPAQAEVHMVSMNVKSRKYHEPGCRYYGCNSCDEVGLDEAVAAGGIPCKKCH
jgi:PBP1b-binding outer membrane lipoprotein LpoB